MIITDDVVDADDVTDDDVTDDDVTAPSFAKSLGLLSTLPTLYPAGMWGQHPPGFSRHFKQPFSPTAGVLLEVLQGKKARYIEDYQRYARAIQPYLALGMRTLLVIPVLQRAHIVKIILLSSYKQVQPLSEEQLAIARSFVRRLENAIERVDNVREVESTREATLRALGLALEYRDFETKGHSERVVALSLALATNSVLTPTKGKPCAGEHTCTILAKSASLIASCSNPASSATRNLPPSKNTPSWGIVCAAIFPFCLQKPPQWCVRIMNVGTVAATLTA